MADTQHTKSMASLVKTYVSQLLRKRAEPEASDEEKQLARLIGEASRSPLSPRPLYEALRQVDVSPGVRALLERRDVVTNEDTNTNEAWPFFGELCRAYWQACHPGQTVDPEFAKEMFYEGQFPAALTGKFTQLALSSPQVPFAVSDTATNYYSNQSTVIPYVDTYNNIFVFRKLSPSAMSVLSACIASIAPTVTKCLGSDWRVVQTRYWEVKPGGEGIGTNGWHTDGFPLDAIKILSFFSEVDEEKGSTQFKKRDGSIHTFRGPAGKWVLFRNSIIEHCGSPPKAPNGNRLTVEITIAPALATEAKAVFAGVNGHFPFAPWSRIAA